MGEWRYSSIVLDCQYSDMYIVYALLFEIITAVIMKVAAIIDAVNFFQTFQKNMLPSSKKYPNDGGIAFLRNVRKFLLDCMA
jgi:hypothetical protein